METARIYIKDKLPRSGMTLAQIADLLSVTKGAVTGWADGSRLPQAAKLPALAAALGCTVDDLYREEVRQDA